MKVRMIAGLSGTHNGVDWPAPGEIADVSPVEGEHLIANGLAEPAKGGPQVETAEAPAPAETASAKPRKRKAAAKKAVD